MEFITIGHGLHRVDGDRVERDGVPVIFLGGIKDLAVFLARFDEDVLWHCEAMWEELPKPVRNVEDVIVAFFLFMWP